MCAWCVRSPQPKNRAGESPWRKGVVLGYTSHTTELVSGEMTNQLSNHTSNQDGIDLLDSCYEDIAYARFLVHRATLAGNATALVNYTESVFGEYTVTLSPMGFEL